LLIEIPNFYDKRKRTNCDDEGRVDSGPIEYAQRAAENS
jgi:hypothetical protein